MHIRPATDHDQTAWDTYVMAHPQGLAYQLSAWRLAISRAYGFSDVSLLAEDKSSIRGILPLVDFRLPFKGSTLISLPYCDAGGVLADSVEMAQQLLIVAQEHAREDSRTTEIRSINELPVPASNQTDKVRMVLELPGSSNELSAGLKAKLRSQVKKPMRDGLTAKLGGFELVPEFYPIFARNMRDLGSPVHSRRWIEAVVAAYGDRCRVGIVYTPDDVAAAAGIILLHRQTASIPWASAVRDYNHLNPNMLLYWTFLSFAADNGFKQFDFGRSTPGEGTYKFKQQWGAQPRLLYWYRLPGEQDKSNQEQGPSSARIMVEKAWQRLPLGLANTLGPRLRKYIAL